MVQRPAVRTTVLILFAALAVGSIGFNLQINSWLGAERQSARAKETAFASATADLADLRAAQAAYLSVGQGVEVWMARANDVLARLNGTIGNLREATQSADAGAHYDAAATAMKRVDAVDVKARDFIVSGQRFMASDVVFMDGVDNSGKVGQELDAAQQIEDADMDAKVGHLERWRLIANAGVLAIGLLIAMALGRAMPTAEEAVTVSLSADAPSWKQKGGEPLGDANASSGINLNAAADLCVDLARVLDERDLPTLLGRAATVLDAKGLVLWIVESSGADLHASIAHGYPEKIVQRMGALPTSADNVTSLAFRTMSPQTLRGSVEGHAAMAIPILSATGCVGVLSVELQGGTSSDAASAIAKIIAAQLATLVSPVAAAQPQRAAQA